LTHITTILMLSDTNLRIPSRRLKPSNHVFALATRKSIFINFDVENHLAEKANSPLQ